MVQQVGRPGLFSVGRYAYVWPLLAMIKSGAPLAFPGLECPARVGVYPPRPPVSLAVRGVDLLTRSYRPRRYHPGAPCGSVLFDSSVELCLIKIVVDIAPRGVEGEARVDVRIQPVLCVRVCVRGGR